MHFYFEYTLISLTKLKFRKVNEYIKSIYYYYLILKLNYNLKYR